MGITGRELYALARDETVEQFRVNALGWTETEIVELLDLVSSGSFDTGVEHMWEQSVQEHRLANDDRLPTPVIPLRARFDTCAKRGIVKKRENSRFGAVMIVWVEEDGQWHPESPRSLRKRTVQPASECPGLKPVVPREGSQGIRSRL